MSIDEQPMNVYWSGQRTETTNRSKINYKGSVTAFSDLPDTDNQKGDMYSVTNLNGENYIWDGTAWDSLGTSDTSVVHKTGDEEIAGNKTFTDTTTLVGISNIKGNKLDIATPESSTRHAYLNFIDRNGKKAAFLHERLTTTSNIFQIHIREIGDTTTTDTSLLSIGGAYCSSDYTDASLAGKYCFRAARGKFTSAEVALGMTASPWDNSYFSVNPTITSDERCKTEILGIPDEVLNAWADVGWVQFKMADAVKAKGNAARLHSGLIAQRIDEAFKAHGLDATRYGLFCHDEWGDEFEEGEDGSIVQIQTAGDKYSLRYDEALCMEAAYQRRRADRAEARIKALEDRLEALEARLG